MSEELQKDYSVELPKQLIEEVEEISARKRLNKQQKETLIKEVQRQYLKEIVEPGEAVGIVTSQSISEPATQMTMRTYHFAGMAGIRVTYGLPRLMEIFDAKKDLETPMMTVYLKKEYNNMEAAEKFAEQIIEKKIADVVKNVSLDLSAGCIELELADRRIESTVVKILNENLKNVKVKVRGEKIIIESKGEISIKEFQKMRSTILKLSVSGVKGIENALVRREENDWIITTIGSNLEDVLKLKEIDEKRVFTNDIHETARVLGIEAARNMIIREASKTLQEQGLDVDIRHIMLVSDIMTFSGEVRPIGRYGVAGTKSSILARAAFEETIKHLVRASIRNESDTLQGIFENVMIGQVIPSGTGMFDLIAKFSEEKKEEE
jgi:DNA-directed RNA polymerase subunit A"